MDQITMDALMATPNLLEMFFHHLLTDPAHLCLAAPTCKEFHQVSRILRKLVAAELCDRYSLGSILEAGPTLCRLATENDTAAINKMVIAGADICWHKEQPGDGPVWCAVEGQSWEALLALTTAQAGGEIGVVSMDAVLDFVEEHASVVRRSLKPLVLRIFQECINWIMRVNDDSPWTGDAIAEKISADVQSKSLLVKAIAERDLDDEPDQPLSEPPDAIYCYSVDERHEFALEALDRLACSIGGNCLIPLAFSNTGVTKYLNNSQRWQARHTGLMAIAHISEGCKSAILKSNGLSEIVSTVYALFKDEHPRVRHAAVHCFGQISTDLSPTIQDHHHTTAIPVLLNALEDPCPEVQSHVAACILNFTSEMESEQLGLYAADVLEKLMPLLESKHVVVRKESLTAIAGVADALAGDFAGFYSRVMPALLKMLRSTVTNDCDDSEQHRAALCFRLIEAVSVLAQAVGRERFEEDFPQAMELFLKCHGDPSLEKDVAGFEYMMQGYMRLVIAMEDPFAPYLPQLMPGLLARLKQEYDYDNLGADNKAAGLELLFSLADSIGRHMGQWSAECMWVAIDNLTDIHPTAREWAFQLVPSLLKSMVEELLEREESPDSLVRSVALQAIQPMCESILEVVQGVPFDLDAAEMIGPCMQGLCDLVSLAGRQLQDPTLCAHTLAAVFESVLAGKAQWALEMRGSLDEEEMHLAREQAEASVETMELWARCMGAVIKAAPEVMTNLGNLAAGMHTMMMNEGSSVREVMVAVCVLLDIVEYGGGEDRARRSAVLLRELLGVLVGNLVQGHSPDATQTCAYGLGVAAQFGPADLVDPKAEELMTHLSTVDASQAIDRVEEGDDESAFARDNCIAAFGKFLEFRKGACPGDAMRKWLEWLPLREDEEEAEEVLKRLARLVEKSPEMVLGASQQNLGEVVRVLAGAAETSEALSETAVRLLSALESDHPAKFGEAFSGLSAETQSALEEMGIVAGEEV